jgi:hypothetical protein
MEIPNQYKIIDYRKLEAFKKTTFSNYQKSDVLSAFQKSITNGNVDESCHWMVELLISGYIEELWIKLIILSAKTINIANPSLPQYLYYRYGQYINITTKPNFEGDLLIQTRNVQEIRNHLAEITSIIATSSKNIISKTPKITKEEFRIDNFKAQLDAIEYKLVDHITLNEDPSEVKVVANEIAYRLKESYSSFDRCNYWVHWLLEWEKISSKKCGKFQCGHRPKSYIKPQFAHDFIWLVWDIIFQELSQRKSHNNDRSKTQIRALYELYCYQFSAGNKRKKIHLLLHAILLLTMEINWATPIISNYPMALQSAANINYLFLDYKKIEQSKAINQELPYKLNTFDNYIVPFNKNNNTTNPKTKTSNRKKTSQGKNKKQKLDSASIRKLEYANQIQNKLYNLN